MSYKGHSSRLSSSHRISNSSRISHPSRYIFIANIGSIIEYINKNIDKLIYTSIADDINEYVPFVQILVKIINRYFYIENTNKTRKKTRTRRILPIQRRPPERQTPQRQRLEQRRQKQYNKVTRLESKIYEMRSLKKDLEDKKIYIDIISNEFLRDFYNRLKSYGIDNIDNKRDLGDNIKEYIFRYITVIIYENNRLIKDIAIGKINNNNKLILDDSFKIFYKAYKMYLDQQQADIDLLNNIEKL